MDLDPFLPDQLCGVICQGKKLHWSPREATNVARHGQQLQDYICDKLKCSPNIFQTVDWEGFYRYIKTLDVRQTNIIKMAHNWIHYGHQKDLFSQEIESAPCPTDCGLVNRHQYYLSCYPPPILAHKKKCLTSFNTLWKDTRTVTYIARIFKYVINCAIHEKEPFPQHLPATPSPFEVSLHKTWHERKTTGWRQIFRGRTSSQWALTQGMYCTDHPDLKDTNNYRSSQWSGKVLYIFVESSLDLWAARNKVLYRTTVEEEIKYKELKPSKCYNRSMERVSAIFNKDSHPYIGRLLSNYVTGPHSTSSNG